MLRGWRRWLFNALAALLLLWIVIGSFANYFARQRLEEARATLRVEFAHHEAAFKSDLEVLAGNPLLAQREGGDASPILLPHLRSAKFNGWNTSLFGDPPLPAPLMSELARWSAEWDQHVDDAALEGLDLSWLSTLRTTGYWDLEPVGGPLDAVPFGSIDGVVPHLYDLYWLAKARLLQGLRRGDHREAGAEVRELAKLTLTTESFLGATMSIVLLRYEETAWERARLRGLDVSGWTPVRDAERKQLTRAIFASMSTRSLMSTEPAKSVDLGALQCAALRDPLEKAHLLSRYLKQAFRERYAELDEELSRSQCRLRLARLNQRQPSEAGQLPVSTRALCPGGPLVFDPPCELPDVSLSWLPLVKLPLGSMMILSEVRYPYFKAYRAPAGSSP